MLAVSATLGFVREVGLVKEGSEARDKSLLSGEDEGRSRKEQEGARSGAVSDLLPTSAQHTPSGHLLYT